MTNQVTSFASWSHDPKGSDSPKCWNCKLGDYLVYANDKTKSSRCGRCGELEQDDPAKQTPTKRRTTKSQDK